MGLLFAWGALKRFKLTLAIWLSLAALVHLILVTMDGGSSLCRLVGKFKAVSSLEFIHLFAIGMIFHDVRRNGGLWTRGHALLLAAALGMACWYSNLSDAFVTLVLTGTLYLATTGRLPFLNARPLLWLGLISYPLYLAHQSMGYILLSKLDHLGWNPYLASVVVAAGAISVAALLSYGVEQPVMRGMREAMRQRRSSNSSVNNGQPAIPNAAL
jgi:peptidoglycan/LPS O-acetylase OafA/YrhL